MTSIFRQHQYFLLFACLCFAPAATAQANPSAAPWNTFRCPEELTTEAARDAALSEFIEVYGRQFPRSTMGDMMTFRYRLLAAHSCTQALRALMATVSPLSMMLRLGERDFGPKTEEFEPKTRVWTVRYPKNGEMPGRSRTGPDESLRFNFYGWNPRTAPEAIAKGFSAQGKNLHVYGTYTAPDSLTGQPAHFVIAETLTTNSVSGEISGYVNISKITAIGTGAWAVTFSRKISGTSAAEIEEKGRVWSVSADGQAILEGIRYAGVDPQWQQHFAEAKK